MLTRISHAFNNARDKLVPFVGMCCTLSPLQKTDSEASWLGTKSELSLGRINGFEVTSGAFLSPSIPSGNIRRRPENFNFSRPLWSPHSADRRGACCMPKDTEAPVTAKYSPKFKFDSDFASFSLSLSIDLILLGRLLKNVSSFFCP